MQGDRRIGRFTLRPAARELLDGARALPLGARAFDLLMALAAAGGAVVTRDALLERVWQGAPVGDENLKMQVMALRKLLGATAIVTAPGRGYRLALPLHEPAAHERARPVADGLVGRADELAALDAALREGALVTLAGPGGVGKTRLARAAAAAAGERFADGCAFVELASLADPALLTSTVARAIDLPPMPASLAAERLASALAPLNLLLVLDNCEHLVEACAALAREVHERAPRVAVLATSQQPLALHDERVIRLAGLGLGLGEGAVELFTSRVRRADPAFAPDPDEREAVAGLAARLDGLPLALELAAARVPLLGVRGVLERLDQQLPLLAAPLRDAPPRHQTLRAAMTWSHALLSAREQAVLRRLGVFVDAFTLEAAVTVAAIGDEWITLDVLGALVDKSLLVPLDVAGEKRFRLLVTARDFALERLAEASEEADTRERHAQSVLDALDAAEALGHRRRFLSRLRSLRHDVHELRAALRWSSRPGADPQRLFALVGAAGAFWTAAQLDAEGAPWLERVAPTADDPRTPPLRVARWWQARALRGITPLVPIGPAMQAAARAQALFRELGDAQGEYLMLSLRVQNHRRADPGEDVQAMLARLRALEAPSWSEIQRLPRVHAESLVLARSGDWRSYRDRYAAEARLFIEAGDRERAWGSLYHVALGEIALGRPEAAVAALDPVMAQLRAEGMTRTLWTRAAIHLVARIEAGHGRGAAADVREVVTLLRVARAAGYLADHMAWWSAQCDAPDDGARLAGWADAWYERQGEPRHSHAHAGQQHALGALRARLAADRIERLRAEGRAMPDEVALQTVLRIAEA